GSDNVVTQLFPVRPWHRTQLDGNFEPSVSRGLHDNPRADDSALLKVIDDAHNGILQRNQILTTYLLEVVAGDVGNHQHTNQPGVTFVDGSQALGAPELRSHLQGELLKVFRCHRLSPSLEQPRSAGLDL